MKVTLINKKKQRIKISQEPTDPLCMRVSIGGLKKEGYYLVYRGDSIDDIEEMLKETYEAFVEARKQLERKEMN